MGSLIGAAEHIALFTGCLVWAGIVCVAVYMCTVSAWEQFLLAVGDAMRNRERRSLEKATPTQGEGHD